MQSFEDIKTSQEYHTSKCCLHSWAGKKLGFIAAGISGIHQNESSAQVHSGLEPDALSWEAI